MRRFLPLPWMILVATLSAAPSSAEDTAEGAVALVETLSAEVLETVHHRDLSERERKARLHALLRRGLDIPGIGRFVLGRFWKDATPQQIGEYETLFADYLLATTIRLLRRDEVVSFAVTSAGQEQSGDVLVETRLQLAQEAPVEWAWRVRKVAGELRIVDLLKDGVSMAATYRSEFGAVAANQGMAGLIEILRRRSGQAHTASRAAGSLFAALLFARYQDGWALGL